MKTIGIIGGLSWVSTVDYYRLMNETVNQRLGSVYSARIILYSVEFNEIKTLTFADDWAAIIKIITSIAKKLEAAGADCIVLGANTMHKIADEVQRAVSVPVIHIAMVTAAAIEKKHLHKVALLGTKYTMEFDFYPEKLAQKNITTIIPDEEDRKFLNDAIYNELGKNIFLPSTKEKFLTIIHKLVEKGAEGVILGCTEIPLLIKQDDCTVPVFDTTLIHATAAIDFALEQ